MADSTIAIPAISHEHFLPAMGSSFPECCTSIVAWGRSARRMSKDCSGEAVGGMNADVVQSPEVKRPGSLASQIATDGLRAGDNWRRRATGDLGAKLLDLARWRWTPLAPAVVV
jgi:hypothetical protein